MSTRNVRTRKRQKRKPSHFAYALIFITIAASATAVFATTVLKVKTIMVSGKTAYTAAQIITASGIKPGQNLLSVDKQKVNGNICSDLPNILNVKTQLQLPKTVMLEVTQDMPQYVVKAADKYAFLDKDFKVISLNADANNRGDAQLLDGVQVANAMVGRPVVFKDKSATKTIAGLFSAFKSAGIGKIEEINISNQYEISALYDNRITIHIGTSLGLKEKLRMANEVLTTKISASDKGDLDVSSDDKTAIFSPQ